MQIFDQKKVMVTALDLGKKAFVIYVAYLKAKILIYPAYKDQIILLISWKIYYSGQIFKLYKRFLKKVSCRLTQADWHQQILNQLKTW